MKSLRYTEGDLSDFVPDSVKKSTYSHLAHKVTNCGTVKFKTPRDTQASVSACDGFFLPPPSQGRNLATRGRMKTTQPHHTVSDTRDYSKVQLKGSG